MELVFGDQASKVGCGTGGQEFADPVVDPSKVKTPQRFFGKAQAAQTQGYQADSDAAPLNPVSGFQR